MTHPDLPVTDPNATPDCPRCGGHTRWNPVFDFDQDLQDAGGLDFFTCCGCGYEFAITEDGYLVKGCVYGLHPWQAEPAQTLAGLHCPPFRICPDCWAIGALALDPPPGHPESLHTELPEAHEEFLAALDAATFPEEAR